MTHAAPLELWSEHVIPDWIDYNGHMNVAYYTLVFDHAVDAFFNYVGLGRDYRENTTGSSFAVEHHITYNQEVVEGDLVRCTSRLVGFDAKRIRHYHEMYHAADGYLAATCEFLSLHVDLSIRRVTEMPASILERLGDVMAAHENLPPSDNIGRAITKPMPPAN
jgi:acyl-CoA thioester hydrolase